MTAANYVGSGLVKTLFQTLSGFIVLMWISPEELGQWQSFTVFVSYITILGLGVPHGLNRELPYLLGKKKLEVAMTLLKTAGAYVTMLSFGIILLVSLISVTLFFLEVFNMNQSLMLFAAFSIGAFSLQTNLIGATFRSNQAFDKLAYLQYFMAFCHFILLPIVYFYGIWGYISYQALITIFFYWGYWFYRPYKVKYKFIKEDFKLLVKIGLQMFIWDYLAQSLRTIPRLVLVIFGSPMLVGLFAPAESFNKAVLNLPKYINLFLFPKMSYSFGKDQSIEKIKAYSFKSAKLLFVSMFFIALILALIIPYAFELFFEKYLDSVKVVQIVLFSGVFYSVNALFHNSINSLKMFRYFKIIISLKALFLIMSISLSYFFTDNLLIAAAVGLVASEFLSTIVYVSIIKFKIK